jgi:predicted RNase H-like nuclease
MIVAGLDGFSRGWVAVILGDDKPSIHFLTHIDGLSGVRFDRAGIDIPIGLPQFDDDNHRRRCDLAARERLKPHTSRVFMGATRGLWDFASAADANKALKAQGLPGVSLQLWHLGPKITEVDAFVCANRSLDVRETHPELVFHRLNGGEPLPSKKTNEGIALRMSLLARSGFNEDVLEACLTKTRIGTGAKIDDVLDACACAIAARDFDFGFCLPASDPPTDACKLPMQIWY